MRRTSETQMAASMESDLLRAAIRLARAFCYQPGARAEIIGLFESDPRTGEAIMNCVLETFRSLDSSASAPGLGSVTGRDGNAVDRFNAEIAQCYRVRSAAYCEAGSTGANIRLCMALKKLLGEKSLILVDNVAHLSVISGMIHGGFEVNYIPRRYNAKLDCMRPISAEDVSEAIRLAPEAKAVIVTIPSYDGFVPDLAAIRAAVGKERLLVVDAAWGALHGPLTDIGFPASAVNAGADAAVVSLHKVGIGWSQSSAVLFNNRLLADTYYQVSAQGFATTSPFFLAAGVAQEDLRWLQSKDGRQIWVRVLEEIEQLRRLLSLLPGVHVISPGDIGPTVQGDPHHVLLHFGFSGANGFEVLKYLQKHFDYDAEKATPATLLLLIGPEDIGQTENIAKMIEQAIDACAEKWKSSLATQSYPIERVPELAPGEAFYSASELICLDEAVGRVSAQIVASYPPGAAVIAPGMWIDTPSVEYLRSVQQVGGRVIGLQGSLDEPKIYVVRT